MTDDWIQLQPEPIDVARVIAFVGAAQAGGIDLFLGMTRAEVNASGQHLKALDYEAYAPMALRQLQDLAMAARNRWPIVKLAILHRTGRVVVGEASVAIAVSTPHRADAFEACRWLIDSLKSQATLWKKEVWSDGTGTWVHPQTV